jgi:hypothetical protein
VAAGEEAALMAKRRKFVSQATLEALVRYGPELSGLRELQRTAKSNLRLGVNQAHGTARGIEMETRRAAAPLAAVYDRAGLQQASIAHTLIGHDLAALGPGADAFKAAGATEQAGAAGRLAEAKTQALTDLTSRGVRAKEGEAFQINQARSQFISDLTKVLQRKQDLRGEAGAFKAATIDKLAKDQADRALRKDIAASGDATTLAAAGVNPDGTIIPGGKADPKVKNAGKTKDKILPGGAKLATPERHAAVHDEIQLGISQAKRLKAAGRSRGEIVDILINGRESQTLRVDEKGNKLAQPVKIPGVKSVKPTAARAAVEILYQGGITPGTVNALHRGGISIKRLGYRTAKSQAPPKAIAPMNAKETQTFKNIFGLR